MAVGARESAQYDWLRCAHQVLGDWDSAASYNLEGEWAASAWFVPTRLHATRLDWKQLCVASRSLCKTCRMIAKTEQESAKKAVRNARVLSNAQ